MFGLQISNDVVLITHSWVVTDYLRLVGYLAGRDNLCVAKVSRPTGQVMLRPRVGGDGGSLD